MGIKHIAVKASQDAGLASEWNDEHKIDGNVDFKHYSPTNMVIESGTAFPAGPTAGQLFYRTDYANLYFYDGYAWTAWIEGTKLWERYITGYDADEIVKGIILKGQQFTVGTTSGNNRQAITSVKLKLLREGSPGLITVNLYAVDGAGKPTGAALSTGTLDSVTITELAAGDWYTITMSNYELIQSTQYALVVSCANAADTSLTYGATAFWHLDDCAANTAVIESIGGINGTAQQNTNVLATEGKVNTGLSFNGTTDKVDCTNNAIFDIANTDFSLAAWIYPTTNGLIISKEGVAAGSNYRLDVCSGPTYLGRISWYNTEWKEVKTTGAIPLNAWTHLAGTYASATGTAKIYVNGTLNNQTNTGPGPIIGVGSLVIGASANPGGGTFTGNLDEVGFWRKTLTPAEITGLANPSLNNLKWRKDSTAGAYTGGDILVSNNNAVSWTITSNQDAMFEIWGRQISGTAGQTFYWQCAGVNFIPAEFSTMYDNISYSTTTGQATTDDTFNLVAPVNLPHGATVTAAIVTDDNNETWKLMRSDNVTMATAAGGTEDTTITSPTIDNENYSYFFTMVADSNIVSGARITYISA